MKIFPFVILAFCCGITFGQKYNITRQIQVRSNDNDEYYDQPDLVQIPSSLCHDNGTTECESMDGERYSKCKCICGKKKTPTVHRFYKSTFGFFNGTWKCEKNSALRRSSGCKLSVEQKGMDDPILTVPTTSTYLYPVSNVTTTNFISIPAEVNCSLKADDSMCLTCSGEWEKLNTTIVTKRFRLRLEDDFPHITTMQWYKKVDVQVENTERSSYPLPSGRIIKLAVTCTDRPWEPSQCILLKIQGELQCPVSSPIASPVQLVVQATSVPSLTSQSLTTSFQKPNNINAPKKGSSMGTGLIIGISLSGVAVFAALIILICFVVRLRKRRFIRENDRKSSTAEMVLENKTYGERIGAAKKQTHPMKELADPEGRRSSTDQLVTHEEPLYCLPGSTINQNNTEQNEPFYYEIEESQPHGMKNHNVHEELQPDEEPHVYGTFNEPHQAATFNDPRGYSNTMYDSVGDTKQS